MTLKGHRELPPQTLKLMARLMQLHLELDPHRIARRLGVSAEYVRRQWRNRHLAEMATLDEAVDFIKERR